MKNEAIWIRIIKILLSTGLLVMPIIITLPFTSYVFRNALTFVDCDWFSEHYYVVFIAIVLWRIITDVILFFVQRKSAISTFAISMIVPEVVAIIYYCLLIVILDFTPNTGEYDFAELFIVGGIAILCLGIEQVVNVVILTAAYGISKACSKKNK